MGSTGSGAGVAVQDRSVASPTSVVLDGSFSGTTDWAIIGLEIKPSGGSSLAKLAANDFQETQKIVSRIPDDYRLFQNYPNPFNAETVIEYALPEDAEVELIVYNSLGQIVRELAHGRQAAGLQKINWNGRDNFGRPISSGIYFVSLRAGEFYQLMKITLQK